MKHMRSRLDALRASSGSVRAPSSKANGDVVGDAGRPVADDPGQDDDPGHDRVADQTSKPEPRSEPAARRAGLADLRARLARAGARRAAQPDICRLDDDGLAALLGAEVVAPGVLCKTTRLAPQAAHGRTTLGRGTSSDGLVALSGSSRGDGEGTGTGGWVPSECASDAGSVSSRGAGAAVYFDTETTGLAGGSGTIAFVIGMAWFEDSDQEKPRQGHPGHGHLRADQYLLTRFSGETRLLELASERLKAASPVVSFNGKSFDAPLLSTRCALSRLEDPLEQRQHIDLLHPLRRAFARRWPDCRLASAERRLLGFRRLDDLPGHEAPQAFLDWIHRGEPGRLDGVLHHNFLDLVSLAALPPPLAHCTSDPVRFGADPVAILRHRHLPADGAAQRYLAANRSKLDAAGLLELAQRSRRLDQWDIAVDVWGELAAAGDVTATECLAKYFEHRAGDLDKARNLTATLLHLQPGAAHHGHRAQRLDRKLKRED